RARSPSTCHHLFSRFPPPPPPSSTLFPYTTLFRSPLRGRLSRIRWLADHDGGHAGHGGKRGQQVWGVNPLADEDGALEQRIAARSEEHTSELQSRFDLVCRLLLEKKKITRQHRNDG